MQSIEIGVALAAPTLLFGLILHLGRILDGLEWLVRRIGLVRDPAPRPTHPPIEKVAASLRRLDREILTFAPGTTNTRRRALQLAYDDLLETACQALAVRHELGDLPPGWNRDVERIRVESCLEQAGLCIRDGHRGAA